MRQKQEGWNEFKANLGYRVRPCLKTVSPVQGHWPFTTAPRMRSSKSNHNGIQLPACMNLYTQLFFILGLGWDISFVNILDCEAYSSRWVLLYKPLKCNHQIKLGWALSRKPREPSWQNIINELFSSRLVQGNSEAGWVRKGQLWP